MEPNLQFELFGQGAVSEALTGYGMQWDPGLNRPYIDTNPNSPYRGRPVVTLNTHKHKSDGSPIYKKFLISKLQERGINSPVFNATALTKEQWIKLDARIGKAARFRTRAWDDLVSANSYGGFDAMGTMLLEHETLSDSMNAKVDMDGLTEGTSDAPKFQLEGLPLPITHSDWFIARRKLDISRRSGNPLDMIQGEMAGRRISETLERTTIGNQTGITYGGNSTQVGGYGRTSSVYGYVNFSARLTQTSLYRPTGNGRAGTGWVAGDTLKDVLACLDALRLNKFFGSFMVYTSNDWDQYLDQDYILTGGNVATQTLRDRLRKIDGITDVRRLDMLFSAAVASTTGPGYENVATTYPFTMIFVQMTPDVCEGVNGLGLTTLQWESVGGMRINFKTMCIQVPRLKADQYGNCGILQATFNHA